MGHSGRPSMRETSSTSLMRRAGAAAGMDVGGIVDIARRAERPEGLRFEEVGESR